MENRKPWHLYLIIAVAVLTLYNILPTVFYYAKPLRAPIDEGRSQAVAERIVHRVNAMEEDATDWLNAFCKHLRLKPQNIAIREDNAGLLEVTFGSRNEADIFETVLSRAGVLIPFVPAQLAPGPDVPEAPATVLVARKVDVRLDTAAVDRYFNYIAKLDDNGKVTNEYRDLVHDRIAVLVDEIAGESIPARQLEVIRDNPTNQRMDDLAVGVAKQIVKVHKTFGADNAITKRYFASFTHTNAKGAESLVQTYIARLDTVKNRLAAQVKALETERASLTEQGDFFDPSKEQLLKSLQDAIASADSAGSIIRQNTAAFNTGTSTKPLTHAGIITLLEQGTVDPASGIQVVDLAGHHPYIAGVTIDWTDDLLSLDLHSDIEALRESTENTELAAFLRDRVNQVLITEVARLSRETDEEITPMVDEYAIRLSSLTGSTAVLTFDLGQLARDHADQLVMQLSNSWTPKHSDLQGINYPINSWDAYGKLAAQDQKLGLVVYAPAMDANEPPQGFRHGSLYVIARGMDNILEKYKDIPDDPDAQALIADFNALANQLQANGFMGRPGSAYGYDSDYARDFIFEMDDFYANLLKATREDFSVHGSKRFAVLEFSDVEQRILALNKIDDQIHENLLKWKEDYGQAQVSINAADRYNVPPPTKSTYWENFKLGWKKYVRGDDRKILRWGLDLSGGKTVRIGLRDQNGAVVTNPEDVNQAVNELYTRINKMGVAERNIRVENNNIILEFPGSQGLSASELVKASAMHFHIVNEKFALGNPLLADAVDTFLRDVWDEAVVTNRKDSESIHLIAWEHLGGDEEGVGMPRSEAAQTLRDNGLRLANPQDLAKTGAFDDRISRVARFRGDDRSEWQNQSHPLIVVLNNYALEGSSLANVTAGYDTRDGNLLTFGVRRSYDNKSGSPRDDFYTWTSQFSQDRILGTPKEQFTGGHGWRLAVVLNDEVISAPELRAALTDGGNITGRFTQSEISRLVADLKAGSLSFTPKILSEHNISPELGTAERTRGISAALIGFAAVVAAMVLVYRFAGVVASLALIFNLLIIWGVLQNIDAALSLPGIAAMVLTIGMAVDANVLVFERTREELKISGRLSSALQTGYRKAFSAIIDSNLTTIIAALILIQFDSGPIKGFAITLIIGIAASMFTALFVTRYFFAGWVKGAKDRTLEMREFMTSTNIDFLKYGKAAISASIVFVILGGYLLVDQKNTLFGMDFTGGYALTVDVEEEGDRDYRREATAALLAAGLSTTDMQVQELSRSNQLRIQLGISMEEEGHPFHGLPTELTEGRFDYEWQTNPRIAWVVDALEGGGVKIQEANMPGLDKNWTAMSGQFSDAMRNNALMALTAALICILIYITFRFEFKYAISAVLGLAHDVLITLGVLALLHWIGMPVQIDLQVVGAIMTIIGYSLNDTIIVFDRVREDLTLMRKKSFAEVVNHALNVTLSRTLMTSGTTLLVLLALVTMGGASIFTFSLVMTVGVLVGTLSSLVVAAPALLYFHNREVAQAQALAAAKS